MTSSHRIETTINGTKQSVEVEGRTTLADMLRHQLNLTGTHLGCEHGVCGACTVLVDGRSARSCLMLAVQTDGATVDTVESLAAKDGTLHVLQQAFTSTIARGLSLVAIVVSGLTFAFGEGGSKRVLAGVLFGVGMAIAAVNFMAWLFP